MRLALLNTMLSLGIGSAQEEDLKPAPARGSQGEGPFDRLILRGATLIDGTGAMPRGPVDIVIEKNRIVEVKNVGVPNVAIDQKERPQDATRRSTPRDPSCSQGS